MIWLTDWWIASIHKALNKQYISETPREVKWTGPCLEETYENVSVCNKKLQWNVEEHLLCFFDACSDKHRRIQIWRRSMNMIAFVMINYNGISNKKWSLNWLSWSMLRVRGGPRPWGHPRAIPNGVGRGGHGWRGAIIYMYVCIYIYICVCM